MGQQGDALTPYARPAKLEFIDDFINWAALLAMKMALGEILTK